MRDVIQLRDIYTILQPDESQVHLNIMAPAMNESNLHSVLLLICNVCDLRANLLQLYLCLPACIVVFQIWGSVSDYFMSSELSGMNCAMILLSYFVKHKQATSSCTDAYKHRLLLSFLVMRGTAHMYVQKAPRVLL